MQPKEILARIPPGPHISTGPKSRFITQPLAIIGGQVRAINPVSRPDRQKIGRYMRAVQDAKHAGDFRSLRRRFRRTVLRTSDGELRFETDPAVLLELDDAGELDIDEVIHYEPAARAA